MEARSKLRISKAWAHCQMDWRLYKGNAPTMCYIFSAWCPQSYREGEAQHSRLSISSQSVPGVANFFFCMEEKILVVSDYY